MPGAALPPEHIVRCLPPINKVAGDEDLCLEIDGQVRKIGLSIKSLTRPLMARLPDRSLDLIEIAAIVYGADAAIRRGGERMQNMGAQWHRKIRIEAEVRDIAFWTRSETLELLRETIFFLSDDHVTFEFSEKTSLDAEATKFMEFDRSSAWTPQRVLMFSGGLDSFAGALEEAIEHRQRVALISHQSSTKITPIQRQLAKTILKCVGGDAARHIPFKLQLPAEMTRERTHRTRSLLFAVIGALVADGYGLPRVSFHENGIVSLNLPPVQNVLGTRATRSTHPKSLDLLTRLLDRVFAKGMTIDNPYFWRTKSDVVQKIADLEFGQEISQTRSCADVHNSTKMHPHCGRCSQCVDRRIAVISTGLEALDPGEAYRIDLETSSRERTQDREVCLSYLRNARTFEAMEPHELQTAYPAILDAVPYLGENHSEGLARATKLLQRHGQSVVKALRRIEDRPPPGGFPENSAPRLYGQVKREPVELEVEQVSPTEAHKGQMFTVELAKNGGVLIEGLPVRSLATKKLLHVLALKFLQSAGKGLNPFDYQCLTANQLVDQVGLNGEQHLRTNITRARKLLAEMFGSAGWNEQQGRDLIENDPWAGYRLNPLLATVRKLKEA